ncbi:unnamed protein product [Anisakis simplex]|uniref:GP2 n=1 Tax=Anisakis simplex TaxID=6269 RepID=A0A0M3JUS8_ANISI|nr:unnamed protein product [Anisakis simplex]
MWPWATICAHLLLLCTLFVDAQHHPCALPQIACAARLRSYPPTPQPSADDSSGLEASGWDDSPVYDEFLLPLSPFDFTADANVTHHEICECASDSNCSFANEDHVIQLDPTIELAFCHRTEEIFKIPCRGRRGVIRVIGRIHETGEALTSINESVIFCSCERGYQRIRVEPWINDLYAFIYKCV